MGPILTEKYHAAHIFVHTSGLHLDHQGYSSSWDARLRFAAAAAIWKINASIGKEPSITLTGGEVYQGHPTLSMVGKDELVSVYNISANLIRTGGNRNTLDDFNFMQQISNSENIKRADTIIVSSDYHLAGKLLAALDHRPFRSAEQSLIELIPEYAPALIEILMSKSYRKLKLIQLATTALLTLPPLYRWVSDRSKRNLIPTPPAANSPDLSFLPDYHRALGLALPSSR